MESKARLKGIAKDFETGKFLLTFELDNFLPNMADAIRDCILRLSVKRWKEKRSLDANAYMWVIINGITAELNRAGAATTAQAVYEEMLQRYGIFDTDDNGHICITIRSGIDISRIDGHWKWLKRSRDLKYDSYIKIKGSSELDSGEFSTFLDCILQEAKELGIDVLTPNQKKELEALCRKKAG